MLHFCTGQGLPRPVWKRHIETVVIGLRPTFLFAAELSFKLCQLKHASLYIHICSFFGFFLQLPGYIKMIEFVNSLKAVMSVVAVLLSGL